LRNLPSSSPAEPTLDESRRLLESNFYHRDLATADAVALRHRMSVVAQLAGRFLAGE